MKRILSIAILFLFIIPANAKIHLAAEAGFGNTGIKAGYTTSPSGMVGVMIGKEFKVLLVDIGLRTWGTSYSAIQNQVVNGIKTGTYQYDARIKSLSIPISAGIYLPVGKINILAKANIAPTFLTSHKVSGGNSFLGIDYQPYTEGYYTAAGCDLGLGYSFSHKISIDIKYCLIAYLSELKYGVSVTPGLYDNVSSEKPKLNAFALQLNLFL